MRKLPVNRPAPATLVVGLALFGLLVAPGSTLPTVAGPPTAPKEAAAMNGSLVTANNRFGFHVFDHLRSQTPDKNVFVAPISIALALEMAYNGADGDTRQAMEKALELQGLTLSDVNQAAAAQLAGLEKPDPKVRLDIANSLWIGKSPTAVKVNPAFLQVNREFYRAEIGDLADAPASVNAWVSKKTNGKINNIIRQSDMDNLVALLVNAVYFKGAWTQAFDPAQTRPAPFTLANGRTTPCRMMRQSGSYRYYKGDRFQAVSLPYGHGRMSLYLFLPDNGTSLDALLADVTVKKWDTWMSQFAQMHGDIALPRFRSEYEADLKAPLTALGMGVAFDPGRADFNKINAHVPLWIGKAIHKTVVEVNEEGTEAAAATSVGITTRSVMLHSFRMTLDHPFFCAIRDNKTGQLLFMGAIQDPT